MDLNWERRCRLSLSSKALKILSVWPIPKKTSNDQTLEPIGGRLGGLVQLTPL